MPEKDAAFKLAFSVDEVIEDVVQNVLTRPGHKVKILSIREVDTTHKVIIKFDEGNLEEEIEPDSQKKTKKPQKKRSRKRKSNFLSMERYRDIYREVTIEGADGTPVSFYIGIEIQSTVDNTIFTRVRLYNAFAYYLQSLDYAETKSEGRPILKPVFTVVINLSDKPWDGPTDLLEEMDLKNLSSLKNPEMTGLLLIDPFTRSYVPIWIYLIHRLGWFSI